MGTRGASALRNAPAQRQVIDAHVHLSDSRFVEVEAVLERARDAGIEHMIMAGTEPKEWARQRALAAAHSNLSMSFGLHPWKATTLAVVEEAVDLLERALDGEHPPAAIGETGLDRSHAHGAHLEAQRASLVAHLDLALEYDLPVVLHVVRAHGMMLDLLQERPAVPRGVVHAFDGTLEVARAYEALGLHLSVGGRVCAPEARRLHRSVASIRSERLLIETDAPDQVPHGVELALNEPGLLVTIAETIARLRGQSTASLATQTAENARRLFGLRG
jgi:TatD DNase family protein